MTIDALIAKLREMREIHGGDEPVIVNVSDGGDPVVDVWFDDGVGTLYLG